MNSGLVEEICIMFIEDGPIERYFDKRARRFRSGATCMGLEIVRSNQNHNHSYSS